MLSGESGGRTLRPIPRPHELGATRRKAGAAEAVDDTAAHLIAVLAESEFAGRRIELALASAGLEVVHVEHSVAALVKRGTPDVVIVVSGRSLSERRSTLVRLRKRFPAAGLVVIGPQDSRAAVRATIESGANGLVFEADVERALAPTVVAVMCGQVVLPANAGRSLDPPTLSRREKQVLGLVVMGLSNREIAMRLFLAESTVKCHLSSAFTKLGVRSRHEAVTQILDQESRLGLGILGISHVAGTTAAPGE